MNDYDEIDASLCEAMGFDVIIEDEDPDDWDDILSEDTRAF